jgi:ferredoxin
MRQRSGGAQKRELHLTVDPISCDAYGYCAELLPEVISLDEWGYPALNPGSIPPHLAKDAQRAVRDCPRQALALSIKIITPD